MGDCEVNYRLHDWLISRQRYWGAPIPMVYCDKCGIVPVPVRGPARAAARRRRVHAHGRIAAQVSRGLPEHHLPQCGGPAQRETDTMDTFMCSSWYHYAYVSPYYEGDVPFDPRQGRILAARRSVHGRHRARHDAPDVHALLHQGHARHRPGRFRRADAARCSTRASSWAKTTKR